jgi:thiamine pyrophosphate-dependent acetolactate synthase large subunit-like protein
MNAQSAKQAMMEQLLAEGVRYVFGNPGTTEQPFIDLLQDYPQIEFILALQESVAVGMADAYARVTGRPAFVELHAAPGLGNAMGLLYNVWKGGTPLVVYAGQQDSRALLQEPLLAGDLVGLARPFTKWAVEVTHGADVPFALRRAFKVAMDPPRGPVFVSIPMDVLDQPAPGPVIPAGRTLARVGPDPDAVAQAAALLAEAQAPAIVCGDGVAVAGAQAEVARLAELAGAPVFTAVASEVVVDTRHPLFLGAFPVASIPRLREALAHVDVLLVVGAAVFTQLIPEPEPLVPESVRLIHVHLNPWELGKNYRTDVAVLADPKRALAELAAALERTQTPAQRAAAEARATAVAERRRQARAALARELERVRDQAPIAPLRLMQAIAEHLPPGACVYDESVTASEALARCLSVSEPGSYLRARGGGLGLGMPGTVGLKLARPDRPVVGVVADGAAMYTIQALWTAAHHKVPVTWVICNNRSYRILKLNMLQYLGEAAAGRRFVAMDLTEPDLDFARIAASFGVQGERVEHPDQLAPALRRAFAAGVPALVDVVIDGTVP